MGVIPRLQEADLLRALRRNTGFHQATQIAENPPSSVLTVAAIIQEETASAVSLASAAAYHARLEALARPEKGEDIKSMEALAQSLAGAASTQKRPCEACAHTSACFYASYYLWCIESNEGGFACTQTELIIAGLETTNNYDFCLLHTVAYPLLAALNNKAADYWLGQLQGLFFAGLFLLTAWVATRAGAFGLTHGAFAVEEIATILKLSVQT